MDENTGFVIIVSLVTAIFWMPLLISLVGVTCDGITEIVRAWRGK